LKDLVNSYIPSYVHFTYPLMRN